MRLLQNQMRRLARAARRSLGRRSLPKPHHLWSIGMYTGTEPWALKPARSDGTPSLTRDDVTDVPAHFVADPFMIAVGGRWYLFFEVMNGRSHKGEIGLAVSDDAVRWQYDSIVLREPFHLSYPLVFEWDGGQYMIPETSRAGCVRLYRARRFPHEWEVVEILVNGGRPADASVFNAHGRWWMFAETAGHPRFDVLRLYHAPRLTGPWEEHRQSPVVDGNPHIARPGGRVVSHAGRIVRFAQDCFPTYGTAVRAFAVTRLTIDAYEEQPVGADPMLRGTGHGWNADGMHHVDAHPLPDGRWIACVDGWRAVSSYPAPR